MAYLNPEELALLKKVNKDADWLSAKFTELIRQYNNQFVAVKDQKIAAASKSHEELLKILEAQAINPQLTLIKYLTNEAIII